jgi:2-polyprenyl-3-methyl-5-hydroxy-6-metoxy-1,4-benzoquinol methylase
VDLSQRNLRPELMDQPGLDETAHRGALTGLGRINQWSGTGQSLWSALKEIATTPADSSRSPLRVLELASGGGDVSCSLAASAQRSGVPLVLHGWDISATAVAHARATADRRELRNVQFFQCDALQEALPDDYDVIFCTLFLHHLEESAALALLQRMAAAARRAAIIDDLRRTWLGYWLAWLGCRMLSGSRIVHYDGPLSVQAAFTPREIQDLARQAGLSGAVIRCHWPQRFRLTWRKP